MQSLLAQVPLGNEKINFIWDSVVEEIKGDDLRVQSVRIKNVKTEEVSELNFGGVFVYVGLDPMTDPVTNLGITDEAGWIITNEKMGTTIPGIYAIGDIRQNQLRQIATAVGNGAIAGQEVYNYIEKNK